MQKDKLIKDVTSVLDHAKKLRASGYSVIPLKPGSKIPSISAWEAFKIRLADPELLEIWLNGSERNLAIICGRLSGVVVLDVDNLDALPNYELIPRTPTVRTGRGKHFYFAHPGFPVRSMKIDSLGDVKGDGGYVVCPPSFHEGGNQYEWEVSLETPLALLPDWLLRKLKKTNDSKARNNEDSSEVYNFNLDVTTTAYGRTWFGDVENLTKETRGGRNTVLNTVACKAGSLIAAGQLNEAEARSAMFSACVRNMLVRDDGKRSIDATIESGLREGLKNPRYPDIASSGVVEVLPGKLRLKRLSDYKAEKLDWLWEGVLAKGHITLISGDPGTGKSQLALSLAAIVSSGGKWPVTGQSAEPSNVIILSREDRVEDTIKPRLLAAGVNEDKVFVVGDVSDGGPDREFRMTSDMNLLADQCEKLGSVSLIIIDPVSSYMGDGDINNAGDVRAITNKLTDLIHKYKAAVLMITHNSKGNGTSAGMKVTGSHAWAAAPRVTFSVTKEDDTALRTMAPIKANITKDTEAYCFKVESATVEEGIKTSYVVWENYTIKLTADQILSEKQDPAALAEAKDFLAEVVKPKPIPSQEVSHLAGTRGISERTVRRAKDALGIHSRKIENAWYYVWPSSNDNAEEEKPAYKAW